MPYWTALRPNMMDKIVHFRSDSQGYDHSAGLSEQPSKRLKIFQEDAKLRQTSHWDWDYLSREQLERLAEVNARQTYAKPDGATPLPARGRIRIVSATLVAVGLIVGSLLVAV